MSEVCACKLLDHASLCPGGSSGLLLLQSVAGQQHLALLLLVGLDGTGSLIILSQWGQHSTLGKGQHCKVKQGKLEQNCSSVSRLHIN